MNFNIVTEPNYSLQHRGHSPKGPQDRFSCASGNIVLGVPRYNPAMEIFAFPFKHKFETDTLFVVAGAIAKIKLGDRSIDRYCVTLAKKNDILEISQPRIGVRCYLCSTNNIDESRIGFKRDVYGKHNGWAFTNRTVRVTDGPEIGEVTQWGKAYRISRISDMGIILEGNIVANSYDILSSPVNDGTVQLTKSGPIILMRSRQTIGGYPRILNVINCDLDLLAQMPKGLTIRFERISMDRAKYIENFQENCLLNLIS